MMREARPVACALILILLAGSAAVFAAQEREPPQLIRIEVRAGEVLELDAPDHKDGRRLKKGGHDVRAGKWLRGVPGKVAPRYVIFRPESTPRDPISHTRPVALPPMSREVAVVYRDMLNRIMRPAGRRKGDSAPLGMWHPSPTGRTWVSTFALRWAPRAASPVRFRITAGSRAEVLWSGSAARSTDGSLAALDARKALARALGRGETPVCFEVDAGGKPRSFALRLGDVSTEPELAAQLQWWESHTSGVVQFLGKGTELEKRGFLSAAAEAYYQAWQQDPDSKLLRENLRKNLGLLGLSDAETAAVFRKRLR